MSTTSASATLGCLCQCGEAVNSKVHYRPGHDARHVSKLRDLVNASTLGHSSKVAANMIKASFEALPSDALKIKLARAIENYDNGGLANTLGDMGVAVPFGDNPSLGGRAGAINAKDADIIQDGGVDTIEGYDYTVDEVRVGRWSYPARQVIGTDKVERNTKRDGSGEWVAV